MTEPLIELRGISKSFGKNKVLDDVNLKIYR
ncbi:MAG: ABC transporter ATP-binding protein, partial [Dolichospermum sp.]